MAEIANLVVPEARRAPAAGPSTHVLIIGISHYRHFEGGSAPTPRGLEWGMGQLSAAAGSATEVAAWFANHYRNPKAPIRTLRVLVSPQPEDSLDPLIAPHVGGDANRATRANVDDALYKFVDDCQANAQNVAIVYIVGHGIQLTKHEATVLLEDIGGPGEELKGAIDVIGCHRGMDHARGASTQFWFVDACRQRPDIAEQFEQMTGALSISEKLGNVQASPYFLAAASRALAFARPGGRSLFCEALIESLTNSAVCAPDKRCRSWHISTQSLNESLAEGVMARASAEGEVQSVQHASGGLTPYAVLHQLEQPPKVALRVELGPSEAEQLSVATLALDGITELPIPPGWPLCMAVDPGNYFLVVTTQTPFAGKQRIVAASPPTTTIHVEVSE
jgi:hypothetical protein